MYLSKRVGAMGAVAGLTIALLAATPAHADDFETQRSGTRVYNDCSFAWLSTPTGIAASASLNPTCVDARVQVRAAYSVGGRGITKVSTWGAYRTVEIPIGADILYQQYRVDNNGSGTTSPWYYVTFD